MRKRFFLVLIIFSFCGSLHAQQDSLEKLHVLSWNIYMLPKFVRNNTGKIPRAEKIAQVLDSSVYDVIVFQEAFHKGARKRIRKILTKKYPYQKGPANRRLFSLKTNSGLWIFSKYPIVKSQSIVYRNRSGIDAFSRKGALMVELDVNGRTIQVAATHLQNSGGARIKKNQCVEFFTRLIRNFRKPGVPQVLCGDFNISKDSVETYQYMLQTLEADDGELEGDIRHSYDRKNNDLRVEAGDKQDLLDYILVSSNGGIITCKARRIKPLRRRWHIHRKDLSDHYPVEAEIYFK